MEGLSYQVHLVMAGGFATLTPRRAEEMHAEHEALLAAIQRRDGDAAERIARQHVLGAQRRLVHAVSSPEGAG
jgi:DNA-binding GntR family transcriptional regulator